MSYVRTKELKIGMQVAEDIFSPYGSLLVNVGELLDQNAINKLLLHKIKEIRIIDKSSLNYSETDNIETISPEVIAKFTEAYSEKTDDIKEIFSLVATSSDNLGEIEKIGSEITADITKAIGNKRELFHCINRMKKTSPTIYTHSLNVSLICELFAQLLEFSETKKNELVLTGLLHDIGKIEMGLDINTNSLNLSSLNSDIAEKYIQHSTLGYRILNEGGLSKNICLGVLMHHEAVNGSGFPMGAQWKQIHEYAKIIAIANYYEHLTFSGDTLKDINPFEVIRSLEQNNLEKFDLNFVHDFLNRITAYYQGERVELSNNQVGQIIFINTNNLSAPIVKVGDNFIDLANEDGIFVKRIIE